MHLAFEKNEPVATRRGVCVLEWAGSRPNAVATKACRSWSAYRLRLLTINALVFVAAAVRGQTFFHLLAQSLCTEPCNGHSTPEPRRIVLEPQTTPIFFPTLTNASTARAMSSSE
eukprot:6180292-Pleurochrysis_carterae.AAC.2